MDGIEETGMEICIQVSYTTLQIQAVSSVRPAISREVENMFKYDTIVLRADAVITGLS